MNESITLALEDTQVESLLHSSIHHSSSRYSLRSCSITASLSSTATIVDLLLVMSAINNCHNAGLILAGFAARGIQ